MVHICLGKTKTVKKFTGCAIFSTWIVAIYVKTCPKELPKKKGLGSPVANNSYNDSYLIQHKDILQFLKISGCNYFHPFLPPKKADKTKLRNNT